MPDQEETVPFIPYEIQAIPSDFPIPSYWRRNSTPIDRPGSYIKITGRQEGEARLRYQTHSLTVGVVNQEGINPSTLQDAYTNVQFPCSGWGIRSVPIPTPALESVELSGYPFDHEDFTMARRRYRIDRERTLSAWSLDVYGPMPVPEVPKKRKKSGMAEFITRTSGGG